MTTKYTPGPWTNRTSPNNNNKTGEVFAFNGDERTSVALIMSDFFPNQPYT